jgi:hypothetical protein
MKRNLLRLVDVSRSHSREVKIPQTTRLPSEVYSTGQTQNYNLNWSNDFLTCRTSCVVLSLGWVNFNEQFLCIGTVQYDGNLANLSYYL